MVALAKPKRCDLAQSPLAREVLRGLTTMPKRIPAKFFYDVEGSRLFEEITRQPEYYPTRTELRILQDHATEIAALIAPGAALVEFGSGACTKVKLLLDAMPRLGAYVPVDISADFLSGQVQALREAYPGLPVYPVAADFTQAFALPAAVERMPRAGFFPGSTIGNFEPHDAAAFLRQARAILGPDAVMIVGADLVKDPAILHAAYNDKAGVTRAFNLNILKRLNRELQGEFDPATFEHHAFFNRERQRIEMHLASLKRQKVRVAGTLVEFRAGETIHTENSYKYSPDSFAALARGAGWKPIAMWTDAQKYFSIHALSAH